MQRSDFDFDVISGPSAPPLPPRPVAPPPQGRNAQPDAAAGAETRPAEPPSHGLGHG